jgi:hypothetical protein
MVTGPTIAVRRIASGLIVSGMGTRILTGTNGCGQGIRLRLDSTVTTATSDFTFGVDGPYQVTADTDARAGQASLVGLRMAFKRRVAAGSPAPIAPDWLIRIPQTVSG